MLKQKNVEAKFLIDTKNEFLRMKKRVENQVNKEANKMN